MKGPDSARKFCSTLCPSGTRCPGQPRCCFQVDAACWNPLKAPKALAPAGQTPRAAWKYINCYLRETSHHFTQMRPLQCRKGSAPRLDSLEVQGHKLESRKPEFAH